jgi:hypothetical protein
VVQTCWRAMLRCCCKWVLQCYYGVEQRETLEFKWSCDFALESMTQPGTDGKRRG